MSSSDECCNAMANFVANELKNKDFTSSLFPSKVRNVNRNNLSIVFSRGMGHQMNTNHPLLGISTRYIDTPIPTIVLLASGLSESDIDDFIKEYDNSSKEGGAKRTRKNRKVRSRS
jgi:hypothetical protein